MQVGWRIPTGRLGTKLELEVQAPEVGFGKEGKVVVGASKLGLFCRCRLRQEWVAQGRIGQIRVSCCLERRRGEGFAFAIRRLEFAM